MPAMSPTGGTGGPRPSTSVPGFDVAESVSQPPAGPPEPPAAEAPAEKKGLFGLPNLLDRVKGVKMPFEKQPDESPALR